MNLGAKWLSEKKKLISRPAFSSPTVISIISVQSTFTICSVYYKVGVKRVHTFNLEKTCFASNNQFQHLWQSYRAEHFKKLTNSSIKFQNSLITYFYNRNITEVHHIGKIPLWNECSILKIDCLIIKRVPWIITYTIIKINMTEQWLLNKTQLNLWNNS